MADRFTDTEIRLIERYVSVLDFVSRCAQAVDEEHAHYLWDKAGQLERAAANLHEELGHTSGKPRIRKGALVGGVRELGRHYRACRLLHPARVELTAKEIGSILLAVAGADGLTAGDAELERIVRDARTISERTDVRPDQVARVLCALARWEVRRDG